jgi:hypothetical protein
VVALAIKFIQSIPQYLLNESLAQALPRQAFYVRRFGLGQRPLRGSADQTRYYEGAEK